MTILFSIGDIVVMNQPFLEVFASPLIPQGAAILNPETFGFLTNTNLVSQILGLGHISTGATTISFVTVVPLNRAGLPDVSNPAFNGGAGVNLYTADDTTMNHSIMKKESYDPSIQYLAAINLTESTILGGVVVGQTGFDSVTNLPSVIPSDNSTQNLVDWLGITLNDAPAGGIVAILQKGSYQSNIPANAVDTTTLNVNDPLWVGSNGGLSKTMPVAPLFASIFGFVELVGTLGAIRLADNSGGDLDTGALAGAAEFFGTAPGDYAATVAINATFPFPQTGSFSGTGITRIGPSEFNLVAIGTYLITWQVSVTEAGQTTLWRGLTTGSAPVVGGRVISSCVGRATGTSQIVGNALLTTTFANQHIAIANDASASALTVTVNAGGTQAASASLTICRVG